MIARDQRWECGHLILVGFQIRSKIPHLPHESHHIAPKPLCLEVHREWEFHRPLENFHHGRPHPRWSRKWVQHGACKDWHPKWLRSERFPKPQMVTLDCFSLPDLDAQRFLVHWEIQNDQNSRISPRFAEILPRFPQIQTFIRETSAPKVDSFALQRSSR